MFKRYKNSFDKKNSTTTLENVEVENKEPTLSDTVNSAPSPRLTSSSNSSAPQSIFPHLSSHSADGVPPRVFPNQQESTLPKVPKQRPSLSMPLKMDSLEQPDTTIGKGVTFKGELSFKQLLHIHGYFEGDLVSDGKLVIGPSGIVKSNIKIKEAVIEGVLEGNITASEGIELHRNAKIIGNIEAKKILTDEGVTIIGHVNIIPNRKEPEFIEKKPRTLEKKPSED